MLVDFTVQCACIMLHIMLHIITFFSDKKLFAFFTGTSDRSEQWKTISKSRR